MTAVDRRVVIGAEGNNYSVDVDIDGIESVTLQGDLTGSLGERLSEGAWDEYDERCGGGLALDSERKRQVRLTL